MPFALFLPACFWFAWLNLWLDPLIVVLLDQSALLWLGVGAVVAIAYIEWRLCLVAWRFGQAGFSCKRYQEREQDEAVLRSRRIARFRVASVGMSVLLAFLAAEVVFRVFGIWRENVPISMREVDHTVNAWGIREPWDEIAFDDECMQIAFLGDSFVYGLGVERDETFCHLLEGMLADDIPGEVLTINLGWPATEPYGQLHSYLDLAECIDPDIVIHVIYLNDFGVNVKYMLQDIYHLRDDDLIVERWSYVLRMVEQQIRYYLVWHKTLDYLRGGGTLEEREKTYELFERDVMQVRDEMEARGAVYGIVVFPWIFRLDDYPLPDIHEHLRHLAEDKLGAPYCDLLEVYEGRDAEALRVAPTDEHPNAEGHRIAAKHLERFIIEEMLPRLVDD